MIEPFELETIHHRPFDLSRHSGKYLCIIFFSVDDEQSRELFQYARILTKTFQSNSQVRFIAIATDGTYDRLKLFISQFEFHGDILLDTEKTVAQQFRVSTLPAFFVGDKTGTIRYDLTGWRKDYVRELVQKIKEIQKEDDSS